MPVPPKQLDGPRTKAEPFAKESAIDGLTFKTVAYPGANNDQPCGREQRAERVNCESTKDHLLADPRRQRHEQKDSSLRPRGREQRIRRDLLFERGAYTRVAAREHHRHDEREG